MHLLSMGDLDSDVLRAILSDDPVGRADGKTVAVLDYLPLGSGGLALRAAAWSVGALVVTGADLMPGFPRDTDLLLAARVIGAYADALVVRHPLKGAARAAAAVSRAPVISAGDGMGEDPLFALTDLAVIGSRLGGLRKKSIALCGDLRHNRRAHSLAIGLFSAGARVLLVPAQGAEPGDAVLDQLARQHGHRPVRFKAQSMSTLLDMVDSWLLTPDLDNQLSLFSDHLTSEDSERRLVRHQVREVHAIWVASPRDETGEPPQDQQMPGLSLRAEDGRVCVSPLSPGVDGPPEWEARSGPEKRTLANLLTLVLSQPGADAPLPAEAYVWHEGVRCDDPGCVACMEASRVASAFLLTRTDPVTLSCVYCGSRRKATFVGSRVEKRFHRLGSSQAKKILPRNTVFFASRAEALAAEYVESKI